MADRVRNCEPVSHRRVIVYGNEFFGRTDLGPDVVFGGSAPREEVMAALAETPAVVVLSSHSDGLMIPLGARTIICPFVTGAAKPLTNVPRCQQIGRCTQIWSHPTLEEAKAASNIVGFDILRGGVGVVFACGVLRPDDEVIDGRYSPAASMLIQSRFNAIITTWRYEQRPEEVSSIINDLSAGIPVGRAAGNYNRSSAGQKHGFQLCVLGDPEYHLRATERLTQFPGPEAEVPHPRRRDPVQIITGREYLLATVKYLAEVRHEYAGDALEDIRKRLESYPDDVCDGARDDTRAPPVADALLDILASAPYLEKFEGIFPDRERFVRYNEQHLCPVCREPARAIHSMTSGLEAFARKKVLCPGCGPSANLPEKWSLSVDVDRREKVAVISGLPANSAARICVSTLSGSIKPYGGQVFGSTAIPLTSQGSATIPLIAPTDVGPVWFQIILASLPHIGSITVRARP
jgi:hypothetical protein